MSTLSWGVKQSGHRLCLCPPRFGAPWGPERVAARFTFAGLTDIRDEGRTPHLAALPLLGVRLASVMHAG